MSSMVLVKNDMFIYVRVERHFSVVSVHSAKYKKYCFSAVYLDSIKHWRGQPKLVFVN